MKTLFSLMLAISLLLTIVGSAAAARRTPTPPPAPAPVELNSICQEYRSLDWRASCSNPTTTIVFNGNPIYAYFLTAPSPDAPLRVPGYGNPVGVPSNADWVVLTGNGSVHACISKYGTIFAAGHPDCVQPAII